MRRTPAGVALLLVTALPVFAAGGQGEWLGKVPDAERTRANPLADNLPAIAAGAQVYARHCASCHGEKADGIGRRPSLHTARVRNATDGELQWLLRNGSLSHGMPAWSNLPEVQRWQLVRFLHALPPVE